MSLVNDMLRDLDKRRNQSSGGSGSVSLTPAPELPPETAQRPIALYLIVALLIGAGALAWFWLQQDGSNTRELNVAPQLVIESETEDPQPEEIEQEIADRALALETSENPDNEAEVEVIEPQAVIEVPVAQDVAIVEEETNNSESIQQAEVQDRTSETVDSVEQAVSTAGSEESTDSAESAVAANPVDLQQPPAESVKNATLLSPDEKDVLAVQKALQLLAESQTAEAYSVLEQQIIENRYAHQTRETYAKLLFSEGNHLGALELTDAGLSLSPNHSGFKKVKARILISQGRLNEAINLLLTRAPSVNADLEYHELLATAQLASRDYEGALISYTGLVRQDQGRGNWWYGFAASQDSLGNLNAARQGYSRAVNLSNLSASLRRRSQERLAVLSQ